MKWLNEKIIEIVDVKIERLMKRCGLKTGHPLCLTEIGNNTGDDIDGLKRSLATARDRIDKLEAFLGIEIVHSPARSEYRKREPEGEEVAQ